MYNSVSEKRKTYKKVPSIDDSTQILSRFHTFKSLQCFRLSGSRQAVSGWRPRQVRKSKYMFLRRTMNHSTIGINYCYQLRLLVFGAMVLVLSPQVKIEREVFIYFYNYPYTIWASDQYSIYFMNMFLKKQRLGIIAIPALITNNDRRNSHPRLWWHCHFSRWE